MKIITINIEKDKHLHRILPFIASEMPNVLCLQEIKENAISDFEKLGYRGTFAPMFIMHINEKPSTIGIALLSRHDIQSSTTEYYSGSKKNLCLLEQTRVFETIQKVLIHADICIENEIFTIGTTHFTWTPDGASPAPEQSADMKKFLAYISTLKPHVICGDFNIPREHSALYHELTKHYTDSIPQEYKTSLDASLHRLTQIPGKERLFESYMVDYILTQPPYKASDVRLQFGISDHAGIIGTISK